MPADPSLIPTDKIVTVYGVPSRGISRATCEVWQYGGGEYNGRPCHVATYCDPQGTPVAQKLRFPDKSFIWRGVPSKAGLFGRHLWRDAGKMVVVTEGEIDALSVSQAQGNRFPAVSVPDGASSAEKSIKDNLSWLERFERVVLMFDMDEPGQKAARECAALLTPGKAFIAHLPRKDANEVLQHDGPRALLDAAWGARQYRPEGILVGEDLWETLSRQRRVVAHLPFPRIDQMTRGVREGDIVLLVGGVTSGKSTLCRILTKSFVEQGLKVGVIPLEESPDQYLSSLLGTMVGRNIREEPNEEDSPPLSEDRQLREKFDDISDHLVFYDDNGDRRQEAIFEKIRYMAVGLSCQVLVLDHLTVVLGQQHSDSSTKHADALMSDLEALMKRTRAALVVVMHLKKTEGKPHEEGRRVSLGDVRGSGLIGAFAHSVFAYERDQQSERADLGDLRLLKCRWTGMAGPADKLRFVRETGDMVPYDPVEDTFSRETPVENSGF